MNAFRRSALVLIALVFCFASLPVQAFADSPDATFSVVGYSGTGMELPSAPDEEPGGFNAYGFSLNVDKTRISLGESFQIGASFSQVVESNAAILTCSYDPEELEYLSFEPGGGVAVVDEEVTDGEIRLTFMILGSDLQNFGSFSFAAGESQELYGRECAISASADYVLWEGDDKIILSESSSAEILLADPGDVNRDGAADLLDLSDIIDFFGIDSADPDWSRAKWFDIDRSGSIDILDVSHIARIIAGTRDLPENG